MERSASPAVRSVNATLLLLLAINLFNFIDRYVLAAVLRNIKDEFHASDFLAGSLQTAFLVSYMLMSPVFGWMGDRFGRWRIVGIAVIAWSLASAASGLAAETGQFIQAHLPSLAALFSSLGISAGIGALLITRMFVGVGEAAYGPIAPTIIADIYPVERRGKALTWFYLAIPVGSALGFLLGGLILARLSWPWAFFAVLPPGIVLGLLCFVMREPKRGAADSLAAPNESALKKVKLSDCRVLLKTPSYLLATAGMAAMTFALGGIAIWMPTYIVWRAIQAGELNPANAEAVNNASAAANQIFGPIIAVAGLGGTLVGGLLADRLRPRIPGAYFFVSGIAMALAFPLFLALPITPFPAAWLLIFVTAFCLFINTGPTNTILVNVAHPAMRATGFAVNIFVIHLLGDAVSPALIGWINDLAGGNMNAGFTAISITILISGLFWIAGTRFLARDTALAPTRLDDATTGRLS